jgi:hypothetical protein
MFTKNIGSTANFLGWKMNDNIVREVKNDILFGGHRKVVRSHNGQQLTVYDV